MKKSIRKATMTLGVAAMLMGVAGQASAASYKGISVTPMLLEGDNVVDGVKFAIKNDNGWYVTSDVRVQIQLADGTWDYVGYATAVKLTPEQKEYIVLPSEAFKENGVYRYETQTTKDDTGYNVGTFTSEAFKVYGNYVAPAPEPEYTWDEEAHTEAGIEYDAEQTGQAMEDYQTEARGDAWEQIMWDRYNDSPGG